MKRKRKGHLPAWVKPMLWGKGRLERIIWLNLFAGLFLIGSAVFCGWQSLILAQADAWLMLPFFLFITLGFYLFSASAWLIFHGYAEDEEE